MPPERLSRPGPTIGPAVPVVFGAGVDDDGLEIAVQPVVLDGEDKALAVLQAQGHWHTVARCVAEADHFGIAPCGAVVRRAQHGDVLPATAHIMLVGKEELHLAAGQLHHGRLPAAVAPLGAGHIERLLVVPPCTAIKRIGHHDLRGLTRSGMRPCVPGIHQTAVGELQQLGVGVVMQAVAVGGHLDGRAPAIVPVGAEIDVVARAVHADERPVG